MYIEARTTRTQFQEIMVRKERDVRGFINENLDGTERFNILRDPNGLGFRVAFHSIRAKELLLKLHREVFSLGFAEPKPELDESGVWSAWFGYAEPWEPAVHYLTLQ